MLTHIIFSLRSLAHEVLLSLVALLLVVLSFVPLGLSTEYNNSYYSLETYREALFATLDTTLADDYLTSTPQPVQDRYAREIEALSGIITARSNLDKTAEFANMLLYEQLLLEDVEAGTAIISQVYGGPNLTLMQMPERFQPMRVQFIQRLIDTEIREIHTRVREMPASYYLAWAVHRVPSFVFYLPAIAAFACVFANSRKGSRRQFHDSIPLINLQTMLADLITGWLAAAAILIFAALPVFIYFANKNGIGQFNYPVLDFRNGQIYEATVGSYLLRLFILVSFGNLFLAAFVGVINRLTSNQTTILALLLLVVLVPALPQYTNLMMLYRLPGFIPMSFLNTRAVIGIASGSPSDTTYIGIEFTNGIMILSIWALINFGLAMLAMRFEPLIGRIKSKAYIVDKTVKTDKPARVIPAAPEHPVPTMSFPATRVNPLLAHAFIRLKALLREYLLVVVLLALMVMSFIPLQFSHFDFAFNYSIEHYQDNLYYARLIDESDNFQQFASEALIERYKQEVAALEQIISANESGDRQVEFTSRLRYEQLFYEGFQDGSIIGTTNDKRIQERSVLFMQSLVDSQILELYNYIEEMPATYYLVTAIQFVPAFVFYLPAVFSYCAVFASRRHVSRKQTEQMIPLSRLQSEAIDLLVGWLAAAFLLFLAMLPTLILTSISNGIGHLNYPVVDFRNDSMYTTTIGGYLMQFVLLLAMGNLALGSLACLITSLSENRLLLMFVLVILVFIAGTDDYYSLVRQQQITAWMPLTYFDPKPVIGYVITDYATNTLLNGVDLPTGVIVLGITILGIISLRVLVAYLQPVANRLRGNAYLLRRVKVLPSR